MDDPKVGDIVKIREGVGAIEAVDKDGVCILRMKEALECPRYIEILGVNIIQLLYRQAVDTNDTLK